MPASIKKCVKDVEAQGKDKSAAYGICAKSTGWVRKKGGGWRNEKNGEVFEYVKESLDSYHKILYTEKLDNIEFHYLDINGKMYRIFIERIVKEGTHLHIGFERKIDDKWSIYGLSGDLNTKEIFGIFGSIFNILKNTQWNSITFGSEELKKSRLYHKIFEKLVDKLNLKNLEIEYNDKYISIYTEKTFKPKISFKYKYNKGFFKENFDKITEGNEQTLKWLRDTKDIRKEIQRLKKLMLYQSDDLQLDTLKKIKFLEKKLKGNINV